LYQLLEGLGVVASSDNKVSYQESVTAPLSRECDNEDVPLDGHAEEPESADMDSSDVVLSAIQKASY
jgi:hypothetical protein